jgi:hypothetical protein
MKPSNLHKNEQTVETVQLKLFVHFFPLLSLNSQHFTGFSGF